VTENRKIVLAYSGGLDTSVAIRWLRDLGWDVIAFTVDLGEKKDLDAVQVRALKTGASAAYVADGRLPFLELFVWPSLQAGAVYEKEYPLATALGRPLIAAMLVQVARREGATAIAHGCTGKGNDQVRFDVATAALAPDLEVVAPVREWGMNRDDEIEYAHKHGIEVPATSQSPYSTDENLWGRSIEAGVLEDPWAEPPKDVYAWTRDPRSCPDEPTYVEVGFKEGVPVALDGKPVSALDLVTTLNRVGGENGVGRIDHLVQNGRRVIRAHVATGGQRLNGVGHHGVGHQARPSARKLRSRSLPLGVRTDSGWNWTPSAGSSRCRTAITTSPDHAERSRQSGSAGSTTSEW